MADLHRYEFYLMRYVPNLMRGEFINIGVILRFLDAEDYPITVRFTKSWDRVLRIDPDADITMFEAIAGDLPRMLQQQASQAAREQAVPESIGLQEEVSKAEAPKPTPFERFVNQLSCSLQISESFALSSGKPALGQDPESEMERLLDMYVS